MTKQLSIEELWEYLPEEYKFVARDEDGDVWVTGERPSLVAYGWRPSPVEEFCEKVLFSISGLSEDWEKSLVERPVDMTKYIGCLGWFWDDGCRKVVRLLDSVDPSGEYRYNTDFGEGCYEGFEPLSEAEVRGYLDAIRNANKK